MQSISSKIILWLNRHRHFFKGKLRPEIVDETFSVEDFRADVDRATGKRKLPKGVTSNPENVAGLQGEWLVPEEAPEGKVLLYIHGGGFISGSSATHRALVGKFAAGTRLRVLLFDYRLAPEHPYPAGLVDCVTAYSWLLENGFTARDIVIGGESAGSTLTLSLLLVLKERGLPQPEGAFCISPVTDLRCVAPSFSTNAGRDLAPPGATELWTRMYAGAHDAVTAPLSPLFGDFTSCCPLHITVGTHEMHLDDCVNVAARAAQQGVDVTLRRWDGMVHAFPLMSPLFPEARQAMTEICAFTNERLR